MLINRGFLAAGWLAGWWDEFYLVIPRRFLFTENFLHFINAEALWGFLLNSLLGDGIFMSEGNVEGEFKEEDHV